MIEGNSQRNAGVSKRLEVRKMLGRILKARPLIVGTNVAGHVDKHITLIVTKEQLDCGGETLRPSHLSRAYATG
jgi:hypothetical protein